MELNLQPLAAISRVSSRPFREGDRVVSYLVRSVINEILRYDVLLDEDAAFRPEGFVFCRWVHRFKPKNLEDNPERLLKLTAENLFLTLADPANEPIPANTPLLQFLALLLERKRILRPRGRTADGERNLLSTCAPTRCMKSRPATSRRSFSRRSRSSSACWWAGQSRPLTRSARRNRRWHRQRLRRSSREIGRGFRNAPYLSGSSIPKASRPWLRERRGSTNRSQTREQPVGLRESRPG
jgi:hypothetical protein